MSTSEGQTPATLKLRAFIDAVLAIAWSALPDGSLDFINQRFLDYTGLSSDQLTGWEWKSVVHSDDIPQLETWWRDVRQSEKAGTTEKRLRRFDGAYRWFRIAAAPVHDEQANLIRWCGINTDIDDLKQTEEGLRASERSWRQIVDCIPAFVTTATAEGEIEFSNQQFLNYFGETLEELKRWKTIDVIHPSDLPQVIAGFRQFIETGQPWDDVHRIRRADGVYRWFQSRVVPQRDAEGRIIRWFSSLTDIDDLKRAEGELKRSEEFLAEGQRLSRTGSFSWCVETDEITWSKQLYRIFEFDESSPVTLDRIASRVYPDDLPSLQDMTERARRAVSDFEYQHRLLMPDQSVKHIHLVAHATRDRYGRLVYVGAAQDVTDLHAITDVIANPIVVLTPHGTTLYANRVAVDQLGPASNRAKNEQLFTLACHLDDIDRVRDEFRIGLAQGIPFQLEMRLLRNGEYRWHLAQYNSVRDERGQIIRWYGTATDIDDRKRTEERLRNENLVLREEIDRSSMFEDIVGSSEPLRKVLLQMRKVAPSDSTVLILGETGTGKELMARAIHKQSNRSGRALVAVNCAAIPPSLIASELFGHEKGAFTGATQRRIGRFEAANGGTIFLDEVGDLPAEVQISLLRVLQEREVEHVGSNKPISVDVRVLAATHHDLEKLVNEGKFRQDLLYRLNVVPIKMPSLRERAADIPLLVEYFIARFGKKAGKRFGTIDKHSLKLLREYQWPGNIRELQNVVERAVILGDQDTFAVDETWLRGKESELPDVTTPFGGLRQQERDIIEAALVASQGRVAGPAGAAAKLGVPTRTLDSKIKRLGIDKYRFKSQAS